MATQWGAGERAWSQGKEISPERAKVTYQRSKGKAVFYIFV